MKREIQMKFKVSEEEKMLIESNAANAGFSSTAAYMRHRCLKTNDSVLSLSQKCEIRDSLQKIRDFNGGSSKIICYVNKINEIVG